MLFPMLRGKAAVPLSVKPEGLANPSSRTATGPTQTQKQRSGPSARVSASSSLSVKTSETRPAPSKAVVQFSSSPSLAHPRQVSPSLALAEFRGSASNLDSVRSKLSLAQVHSSAVPAIPPDPDPHSDMVLDDSSISSSRKHRRTGEAVGGMASLFGFQTPGNRFPSLSMKLGRGYPTDNLFVPAGHLNCHTILGCRISEDKLANIM